MWWPDKPVKSKIKTNTEAIKSTTRFWVLAMRVVMLVILAAFIPGIWFCGEVAMLRQKRLVKRVPFGTLPWLDIRQIWGNS